MQKVNFVIKSNKGKYLKLSRRGNFISTWDIEQALELDTINYCKKIFSNSKLWKKAFIFDKTNNINIDTLIG